MDSEPSCHWDVFVSHNRVDKPWVRETVSDWRAHGLRVFFDEDSIDPGVDVVTAIEDALEHSSTVVLVLTPSAMQSRWVALESSIALFSGTSGLERRVIPVVLEPIDDSALRPAIRRLNRVDLTDEGRTAREYGRLLHVLGVTGLGDQPSHDPVAASPVADLPRFPFPVLSLMGTKGGTGKTTVLVAMAELIASTGQDVLIVDADIESAGATNYLMDNARAKPDVRTVLDAAFAQQGGGQGPGHDDLGAWDVTPDYLRGDRFGRIYLIPGKRTGEERIPWNALANIPPDRRSEAAMGVVADSILRNEKLPRGIGAALIDSGAEQNPLVSAGMTVADYGYIVSSPHAKFAEEVPGYERMHRVTYPNHRHTKMHVVVNQATPEVVRQWQAMAGDAHFVMEDPDFRASAAEGKVDFEGVGLNNLYLNVLKVLQETMSSTHQHLLPEPVNVWVKPYLRQMAGFPEMLLGRARYRLLNYYTAVLVMIAVAAIGLSCAMTARAARAPAVPVSVAISPGRAGATPDPTAGAGVAQIPESLQDRVAVRGSELVLTAPLSDTELTSLESTVRDGPTVAAIRKANSRMEDRHSTRVSSWAIAGLLGFAIGVFSIGRYLALRKQKALLRQVVRTRDSGDEQRLTAWIEALLSTDRGSELGWLRSEFRAWLAPGGIYQAPG